MREKGPVRLAFYEAEVDALEVSRSTWMSLQAAVNNRKSGGEEPVYLRSKRLTRMRRGIKKGLKRKSN